MIGLRGAVGRPVLVVTIIGALAILGGCTASPDVTDPAAPSLVHGVVHDIAERPIAGSAVHVIAHGRPTDGSSDEPPATIFEGSATADADGRFEIRLAPTDTMVRALDEAGAVHFSLIAMEPDGTRAIAAWSFDRTPDGAAWAGEPPGVVLRPVNSGPGGCC